MLSPHLTMRALTGLLVSVVALAGCATTHGMSPEAAHAAFTQLVDDFFAQEFTFNPVDATNAGLHQYDGAARGLDGATHSSAHRRARGALESRHRAVDGTHRAQRR